MENPAALDHPVHSLIERRWSPRAFADKPVDPAHLESLLEAARWAPSSFNEQPWRFIVATREDPENFQRLLDCLAPGNQEWAGKAAVLMLSVASLSFARNGKPNQAIGSMASSPGSSSPEARISRNVRIMLTIPTDPTRML